MIDINELRRLAQAAISKMNTLDPEFVSSVTPLAVLELLDRLEAAESDALEQARLNGMGSEREAALMAKLQAAEKTNREWLRANAPGGWIDNLRIENEALRAEVIHIKEVEFPRKAQAVADGWRSKCERLEAKIAEMEKQEPVAAQHRFRHPQKTMPNWSIWQPCAISNRPAWAIDSQGYEVEYRPLYALPCAQPAPSVPEVTDAMALAFHHALTDGSIGAQEVEEIKDALRAALAAPEAKP